MQTVKLAGGIGNQCFQFAFGRALQHRGQQVQFKFEDSVRPYSLDQFNVNISLTSQLYGPIREFREKTFAFDSDALEQSDGTFFNGCWQAERYFHDISAKLRAELTLKNISTKVSEMGSSLQSTETVFLHVRRGDYLQQPFTDYHGLMGLDYYERAVQHIISRVANPRFIVFSDDAEWCKQNLPYEVVTGFAAHEDLYLMSRCKHAVIANSTFSWWSAWLGDEQPDRIVIAPSRWFAGAKLDTSEIIPKRWATI